MLSQHLDSLSLIDTVVDVLMQTADKLLKIVAGIIVLLNQQGDTLDKFLGNLANRLGPILPVHLVAHLLNQAGIDAILKCAKA